MKQLDNKKIRITNSNYQTVITKLKELGFHSYDYDLMDEMEYDWVEPHRIDEEYGTVGYRWVMLEVGGWDYPIASFTEEEQTEVLDQFDEIDYEDICY